MNNKRTKVSTRMFSGLVKAFTSLFKKTSNIPKTKPKNN